MNAQNPTATAPLRPLLRAEVRGAKVDSYSFIDKATGKQVSGSRILIAAELATDDGSQVLAVTIRCPLPEGADVASYKAPVKRGEVVFFALESFEIEKGSASARIAGVASIIRPSAK